MVVIDLDHVVYDEAGVGRQGSVEGQVACLDGLSVVAAVQGAQNGSAPLYGPLRAAADTCPANGDTIFDRAWWRKLAASTPLDRDRAAGTISAAVAALPRPSIEELPPL